MTTGFPFMMPNMMSTMMPGASHRDADAIEMWMKPGREAFEFWVSFFPTAPLFGVEWRFAGMADPAANPFMSPGLIPGMVPSMRAAAMASHPGELATPAAADEDAAKPVARAADAAGNAATDMTRIAGETGKAAARTAGTAMKAGAEATKTAVDTEAAAVDAADNAGRTANRTAKLATETAMTAAEDAATTAEIAAKETADTASKAIRRGGAAAEKGAEAAGTVAERQANGAGDAAKDVDEAVAAAPKPKMLLAKRPDETDDLKAIKGIGPSLEQELNGLGLYRFDQLAKMSDADLSWVDANITRFKGRCFRDDWVGQAKSRLSK